PQSIGRGITSQIPRDDGNSIDDHQGIGTGSDGSDASDPDPWGLPDDTGTGSDLYPGGPSCQLAFETGSDQSLKVAPRYRSDGSGYFSSFLNAITDDHHLFQGLRIFLHLDIKDGLRSDCDAYIPVTEVGKYQGLTRWHIYGIISIEIRLGSVCGSPFHYVDPG